MLSHLANGNKSEDLEFINATKPRWKKLTVQCNDNWPKQNRWWKAETDEEAWQRVLCKMKVKHYKIKNWHCIHEDQQSDCTCQPKRAYGLSAGFKNRIRGSNSCLISEPGKYDQPKRNHAQTGKQLVLCTLYSNNKSVTHWRVGCTSSYSKSLDYSIRHGCFQAKCCLCNSAQNNTGSINFFFKLSACSLVQKYMTQFSSSWPNPESSQNYLHQILSAILPQLLIWYNKAQGLYPIPVKQAMFMHLTRYSWWTDQTSLQVRNVWTPAICFHRMIGINLYAGNTKYPS
jgi:hypothetical protein